MEEASLPTIFEAKITGVKFGLATRLEISKASISDCPISHASQLANPFLGLPLEAGKCESCGTGEPGLCEGHFGYIELPTPIYHPDHVGELKRMLSLLCLKCLKLKNRKVKNIGVMERVLSCCEDTSQISVNEVKTTDGASYLELKVPSRSRSRDGLWTFLEKYGFRYGDTFSRPLLPSEVMAILRKIPQDTRKKLSVKGYFPQEGYILQQLPVPPNCLSVPDISDGISTMSSDHSITLLKKVLKQVEIIKNSRSGKPNFESHEIESNDLQAAVAQYLEFRGTGKASRDVDKRYGVHKEVNASSTKAWLEKMKTLFIRKGSGFSSRSVITGDPFKGVSEIGLPFEIAQKITFEERVNQHNMAFLQRLVDEKLCLTYRDGMSTYSLKEGSKGHTSLRPGQVVHRKIMDGDVVFINRPPTTHKHSLQALSVYIHDDHTVKINPLICGPLSADFDGDCIHLFYPQSLEAKAEVVELFSVEKQLLSSHTGNFNLQLATDSLLSLKTMFRRFHFSRSKVQQLAMFVPIELPKPAVVKSNSGPLWTASQVFQSTLPPSFDCTGERYMILKSDLVIIDFNRDVMASILNDIVTSLFFLRGPKEVLKFFDSVQPLLMENLFSEGFSVSLGDFFIPGALLEDVLEKVQQISPLLYHLRASYNESIALQLDSYLRTAKLPISNYLQKSSAMGHLIDSKSESALSKVVQQVGFLGIQISDRGKFYSSTLVKEMSSLFQTKYPSRDDNPVEEFGLVSRPLFHGLDPYQGMVHSISSREVIVRSSRGLTEPGTLFKNLMAILRDVVISHDGTVRNMCSNSIIQFEYGVSSSNTANEFCAGDPVGVLAATAMSNPAYKAVLDSSPSSNNSWEMMKEILLCGANFKNDMSDRRVILYLNNCGCGRKHCEEVAALAVKNQLKKVSLKDSAIDFLIEYKSPNMAGEGSDIHSGLVGHIHLNKALLKDVTMENILEKCQDTINAHRKKKKFGNLFKRVELSFSDSCSFCQSSESKSTNMPCVQFVWQGSPDDHLERASYLLADTVCPVLLQTIIKGDPRVSTANIVWISPDSATWIRSPSNQPRGELALDVIIEKEAVRKSGDAWRVIMDSCLPVIHLIDTQRSIPYAIKQVQELLGISCAFEQAVQRLSTSVTMVTKGVLKDHLLLLGNSMTCGGTLIGFNAGGIKSLSRSLNVQVPFMEATLFTPRRCFERAAEKCHVDNLSSVVASCAWGKHVSVGTGSRFEILWDTRKAELKLQEEIDVYNFLHLVSGSSRPEDMGTNCLGTEIDDLNLEDEFMETEMSPVRESGQDKPTFEEGDEFMINGDDNDGFSKAAKESQDSWSAWGKKVDSEENDWTKKAEKSVWNGASTQKASGSSWGQESQGGSTWGKKEESGDAWSKKVDSEEDNWTKKAEQSAWAGASAQKASGSTWGQESERGSTWGKKEDSGDRDKASQSKWQRSSSVEPCGQSNWDVASRKKDDSNAMVDVEPEKFSNEAGWSRDLNEKERDRNVMRNSWGNSSMRKQDDQPCDKWDSKGIAWGRENIQDTLGSSSKSKAENQSCWDRDATQAEDASFGKSQEDRKWPSASGAWEKKVPDENKASSWNKFEPAKEPHQSDSWSSWKKNVSEPDGSKLDQIDNLISSADGNKWEAKITDQANHSQPSSAWGSSGGWNQVGSQSPSGQNKDAQGWGPPKVDSSNEKHRTSEWGQKKESSVGGWGSESQKNADDSPVSKEWRSPTGENTNEKDSWSQWVQKKESAGGNWGSASQQSNDSSSQGWSSQIDSSEKDAQPQWGRGRGRGRGWGRGGRGRESSRGRGPPNSGEWKSDRPRPPKPVDDPNAPSIFTVTRKRLDQFTAEEQDILSETETIMKNIRRVMNPEGYTDGDPLSADDKKYVIDNVFNHHPDKAAKMGAGLDYIMVSKHQEFLDTRCFYAVSVDGQKEDFSYRKCLENFLREKYPDKAEAFLPKYFRRPQQRPGWNRDRQPAAGEVGTPSWKEEAGTPGTPGWKAGTPGWKDEAGTPGWNAGGTPAPEDAGTPGWSTDPAPTPDEAGTTGWKNYSQLHSPKQCVALRRLIPTKPRTELRGSRVKETTRIQRVRNLQTLHRKNRKLDFIRVLCRQAPISKFAAFSSNAASSCALDKIPVGKSLQNWLVFGINRSSPLYSDHIQREIPQVQNLNHSLNNRGLVDASKDRGEALKKIESLFNGGFSGRLLDVCACSGELDLVQQVLDGYSLCKDSITWNRLISFCIDKRLYNDVLSLFRLMLENSIPPDENVVANILQSCGGAKVDFHFVEQVHARIIRCGFGATPLVCNPLVDLYLKNELVDSAVQIFRSMRTKDSITWVAMISGLSRNLHELNAILLYCDMRRSGVFPTPYIFSSVISSCTKIECYELGMQLHSLILKWGFSSELFVCNALVSLYSRSGNLTSAEMIFAEMSHRDNVSYNTLITGLAMQGLSVRSLQVFYKMHNDSLKPDCVTVSCLLGTCASSGLLHMGMQLHSYAIKAGMCSDIIIEGSLLDLYVKCSDIKTAHKFFLSTKRDNVVLWNVMLVAYGQMGSLNESVDIYSQMHMKGLRPNQYTYPSILRTCTLVGALDLGEQVHSQTVKTGFQPNVYVCSVLIDMYAKHGKLETAQNIFRRLTEDDIVSWTAMIAGYAQHDMFIEALKIFIEMLERGIRPDNIGFASVTSACAGIQALNLGRQIHTQSIVSGYSSDLSIGNALVCLYARCACKNEALLVFGKIHAKDNISWNGLISGFAQSGLNEEASRVFSQMIEAGEVANMFTYGSAVSAAANSTNLKLGNQIHANITKTGYDTETEVCNVLITLYAKCGRLDDARRVFIAMPWRNEVSWNAMITGYSQHGCGQQAIDLFEDMKKLQLRPNHITYVSVLSACSHVGLVEEGLGYFKSMSREYGLVPKLEHYACVVDILGRAGQVSRAKAYVESMPIEPDAMVWRTLLSACMVHKNIDIGEVAAKHLLEVEPKDSATYVLTSNMYAVTGKWENRDQTRQLMKNRGVKKEPGRSWIEVKNSVHAFFVGDRLHPLVDDIYEYLDHLNDRVSAIGYVPDRNSLWNDSELGQKDPTALVHSEKLAIAFGLLNLADVIPLQVMKNLRVCNDCHNWIKFVSKISNRTIVVRDAYRFHHFENGVCSCKDYW